MRGMRYAVLLLAALAATPAAAGPSALLTDPELILALAAGKCGHDPSPRVRRDLVAEADARGLDPKSRQEGAEAILMGVGGVSYCPAIGSIIRRLESAPR